MKETRNGSTSRKWLSFLKLCSGISIFEDGCGQGEENLKRQSLCLHFSSSWGAEEFTVNAGGAFHWVSSTHPHTPELGHLARPSALPSGETNRPGADGQSSASCGCLGTWCAHQTSAGTIVEPLAMWSPEQRGGGKTEYKALGLRALEKVFKSLESAFRPIAEFWAASAERSHVPIPTYPQPPLATGVCTQMMF